MQINLPSRQTVKNIVTTVVGITTARVVKTVIANNIDSDLSKSQKAQAWVGTAAVAMTVSSACERHVSKLVDSVYDAGAELKQISNDKNSAIES